jgi:hypothetical protein
MRTKFPTDWFTQNIPDDINLDAPGIYEWRIEGVGVYVGKSKRLRSRLKEYPNNVRKIVEGRPYRKNNHDGFRVVHHKLREGRDCKLTITFTVLQNCNVGEINKREQFWIKSRRDEQQAGGLTVLNSN